MMASGFALIVTDTSPLITLAKADALDTLLRPGWPLAIPDVVYTEAVVDGYEDSRRILAWVQDNAALVRIEPTNVGLDHTALTRLGRRVRNYGETAAFELLDRFIEREHAAHVILIYEDSDVDRRRDYLDERIAVVTTGGWLRELERAGLIQSATRILDDAAAVGRNIDRQRDAPAHSEIAEALAELRRDR